VTIEEEHEPSTPSKTTHALQLYTPVGLA